MFQQLLTPIGGALLPSFLVAVLPIIVVLLMLGVLKLWRRAEASAREQALARRRRPLERDARIDIAIDISPGRTRQARFVARVRAITRYAYFAALDAIGVNEGRRRTSAGRHRCSR